MREPSHGAICHAATIMRVIYVRAGIPAFVCITGSEHSVSFHLSQEQLGKKAKSIRQEGTPHGTNIERLISEELLSERC